MRARQPDPQHKRMDRQRGREHEIDETELEWKRICQGKGERRGGRKPPPARPRQQDESAYPQGRDQQDDELGGGFDGKQR